MHRVTIATLILCLTACSSLPGQGIFGTNTTGIGVVEAMSGEPLIFRGDGHFLVEVGVLIDVKDSIVTHDDSAIRLRMIDGTRLSLGANSEFVFHVYSDKGPASMGRMSMSQGSLLVEPNGFLRRENSRFEIATPLADLSLGSGDFWLGDLFADNQLDVVLLSAGSLRVSNAYGDARLAELGQGTTVLFGKAPGRVESWPSEELDTVMESTRIEEVEE